ncbi:MAG: translocation/assembly module TamB domain-containing protein [Holosporales bacterium]|nr:translocation/assembly module TamB domain-containing protein [Holosporales bacterium]
MRFSVVIRRVITRALIAIVSIVFVITALQVTFIQRKITQLLAGDTLRINFSEITGFFPFKFSVIGLKVANGEVGFSVDKLGIEMSKSMLHIKNLSAGNVVMKSVVPVRASLSSVRYIAPLFLQKIIKYVSIESLDYDGLVFTKLLFTYGRKIGTRRVKTMLRGNSLDCQWGIVGTSIIADVGINDILANVTYDTRTKRTSISVDYGKQRVSFDGLYDGGDRLLGTVSLPFMNMKLASELALKDDFLDAKLRSDQIGVSGSLEYNFNTNFIVCNNVRFDNGISMVPFIIKDDLTIPRMAVIMPKGKVHFRNINLSRGEFSPGDITVSNVDISHLLGPEYGGTLDGTCRFVNGSESVKLALTKFNVGSIKVPLINIGAAYSASGLGVKFSFEFMKKKNVIEAEVVAKDWIITKESSIKMKGTGKFNIADYRLPADQIASGTIVYNLSAAGSIANPVLRGNVSLKKGYYINSNAGIYLQNIRLDCNIKDNTVLVKNIYLTDGFKEPGNISGSGNVRVDQNTADVNLLLKVNNLSVIDRNWVNAKLVGELTIIGDLYEKCTIKGALNTSSAKVDISSMVFMSSRSINVPQDSAEDKATISNGMKTSADDSPSYFQNVAIDIDLKSSLVVTGMGVDSTWNGGGSIAGSLSEVRYQMKLALAKGNVTVNENTFKLKNGEMLIDNDHFNVNVSAEKHVDNTIVGAKFVQHNGDSCVKFYSVPYMPKNDVLSYMLYNKKSSEISTSEGLAMFSVMNKVTGMGGFDIINKMKSTLGIDSLGIKKNKNVANEEYDAISVGKKIGKVRISVDQGAAKDTTSVVVETKIAKNTKLSVDLSSRNLFGAGILWSRRY